ncbi:MAG: VOC family protein, partial [Phreatobacter sp.]|nr:VOC family protein [Phreatobacter sp.]
MTPALTGIHHLTAVSANAPGNHAFYTQVLGMRLVKRTVNQDDTSAYHLFYGDGIASPGSDITFFEWPVAPERRGTNAIIRTALRVSGEATIRWWVSRFSEQGVKHDQPVVRDGRLTLDFEDPEGQRLALIDDGGAGEGHPWDQSPVPAEHQIRGLGPITASVPVLETTDLVLTHVLGMRKVRDYTLPSASPVHVYAMGEGGP